MISQWVLITRCIKNKLKNNNIGLLFNEGRGEERVEGMVLTEEILK